MKRTVCIFLLLAVEPALAFQLSVVSYNVESDRDTDPAKVVQDLQRIRHSHLWGLVEVNRADLETYRATIGQTFVLIAGETGSTSGRPDDRMPSSSIPMCWSSQETRRNCPRPVARAIPCSPGSE